MISGHGAWEIFRLHTLLSVDIVAISMATPFARFFSSDDRSAWGVLRFHRGLRDNLAFSTWQGTLW